MADKIIRKIDNSIPKKPALKRVAAYARVSSETDRLMHSLSAQISFYSELIQNTPGWIYAGVYADEFISGTSTKNRSEFNRLMEDCDKGKIDIILCKSISRFARNTVDLLEAVRHLKNIGVEIRFEKENVSNMTADGELMMTLLAVFSQSESESISSNVKWGIRTRLKDGTIGISNKHILGYRYDDALEKYIIIPEEAEIVKQIFSMYLERKPLRKICDELNSRGYRTTLGYLFQEASLNSLIHNEIYAGELLRQKTFTQDPLTKVKVKNRGQLEQYKYEDAHEAIIDHDTYALVLEEMKRRASMLNPAYCFTRKIICGCCGKAYTRKKGRGHVHWICRSKKEAGTTCSSRNYRETELYEICTDVLGLTKFDEEIFKTSVKQLTIQPSGDIHFIMSDGKCQEWKMSPKAPPVLKIKSHLSRPKNIFDGMIFCGKCGRRFGRAISDTKDGGHIYWRCRSKSSGDQTCESVNYSDIEIREIYCSVMGLDTFDENLFKSTVNRLAIQESGSIDFYLKDGSIKHFETFKLRSNYHETTSTDAFIGKIRCAECGNLFHRYCGHSKYVYWRCAGKSKVRTECYSHDYADFNIRKVTAYIMRTPEFKEEIFEAEIDHIAVIDNGLEYHFKDGSVKVWNNKL